MIYYCPKCKAIASGDPCGSCQTSTQMLVNMNKFLAWLDVRINEGHWLMRRKEGQERTAMISQLAVLMAIKSDMINGSFSGLEHR